MAYEVYGRICVGAQLKTEAAAAVHRDFVASLGIAPDASADVLFEHLHFEAPKHKKHEPDRVRYERALEAFVDARWDVDCALGGVSPEGVLETRRGYLFVGVRIEQIEWVVTDVPRGAFAPDRPQWLRKGDLTPGSELSRTFPSDGMKAFQHACRSYARAAREILKDAQARLKKLPISPQHEIDWALCRWLVSTEHPSVGAR